MSFYAKLDYDAILAKEKQIRKARVKQKIISTADHSIEMQGHIVKATSTFILINRQKQSKIRKNMINKRLHSDPHIQFLLSQNNEAAEPEDETNLKEKETIEEEKITLRRKSDSSKMVGGDCNKLKKTEEFYQQRKHSAENLRSLELSEMQEVSGSLHLRERHMTLRAQARKVSMISTLGRPLRNDRFAQCLENLIQINEEEEKRKKEKEKIFKKAKEYIRPKFNPDQMARKFKPKRLIYLESLQKQEENHGSILKNGPNELTQSFFSPSFRVSQKKMFPRKASNTEENEGSRLLRKNESPSSIYFLKGTKPKTIKALKYKRV